MDIHRKEFWKRKQADAERLARLERWEVLFNIKLFPEILRDPR